MNRVLIRLGVLWGCLAAAGLPGFAEVSTDLLADGHVQIVVLGSTEGPDPFGMSWRPYRDIPAFRLLNAEGDFRGDGRPDIALPPGGQYVVGWAWNNGPDHDIALSEWTAEGWSPPLFLTASAADELDPRLLATDGGTLHMVWWTRQTESISFTNRQNDSNVWALPRTVTTSGERGRRPTVVVWDGAVHVAFERDSDQPELAQEVVVKRRNSDGSFSESVVARAMRTERLDPVLHSENGWLWMDWKQADDQLAFIVNGGNGWSEPAAVAWTDPSWIGVENVRQQIRQIVMNQGAAPILNAADRRDGDDPPRQAAQINDAFSIGLNSMPTVWHVNQSSENADRRVKSERKQP